MSYDYIDSTERVGDLIVQVIADTSGLGDPRENDNVTTMLFFNHRRYQFGDRHKLNSGEETAFEHGSIPGLVKHISRNESKVLAFTLVGMYDHSGVTIYPITSPGEHPWYDAGGWDSGCLGIAYVTEAGWERMMGDADPMEEVDGKQTVGLGSFDVKRPRVQQVLIDEINEYDDWLRGNVWGYVITKPCDHVEIHHSPRDISKTPDDELIAACPHSEHVESCWGYIGDAAECRKEALAEAKAISESESTGNLAPA